MKNICVLIAVLAFTGCATAYSRFYTQAQGVTPELVAASRANPPPRVPQLDHSGDPPQQVIEDFLRFGYAEVGHSSFIGASGESEAGAIRQGAKLGADVVVIVSPTYTGTPSSVIPITTHASQASYATGSATPHTPVDRYEYAALYFVKKKVILGANWRYLTDSERQAIQSNKGLAVLSVVNGSPAFNADILPGDIVVAIDGQEILSAASVRAQLYSLSGRTIQVSVWRSGRLVEKTIPLN